MTCGNLTKSEDILSPYSRSTINNLVVLLEINIQRHWWALKTIREHGSFGLAIIEFPNRFISNTKDS